MLYLLSIGCQSQMSDWKCKWTDCLEKHESVKSLYNHYLTKHVNVQYDSPIKSCKWEGCDYSAKTNHQLKSHGFRHIQYKQYECNVCGKNFKWKHDRNKHANAVHRSTKLVPGIQVPTSTSYKPIVPSPMSPANSEISMYSPMSLMASPLSSYYQMDSFGFSNFSHPSDTSSINSQADETSDYASMLGSGISGAESNSMQLLMPRPIQTYEKSPIQRQFDPSPVHYDLSISDEIQRDIDYYDTPSTTLEESHPFSFY
eukprot:NODE_43_length_33755_cov_1.178542.p18 type:complete len:257 gc:universal NODE_43_length_33755_cov_1.178542:7310-6540(-)